MPAVSVVIPCYNAEPYIGETLESVFRQTWKDLEVIVVDDGSTDGSAEVVGSFSAAGARLIRQQNKGAAAARNRGYAACSGDYIQFLDADDLLAPNKINSQLHRLRSRPACVASAEWGRFSGTPEDVDVRSEAVWRDLDSIDWLVLSREDGLGMLFPALWLVPRQVAERAGPWDESLSLGDDGEYFTRVLLAADRVLFCADTRCYYRSGLPSSLSGGKSAEAWRSAFRVLALCESHLRAREDSERVRRGFALSWQHLAHSSYPYEPELAERASERAKALHPVTIRPDGGAAFKTLSRLVGWRVARRLQVASGRP